VLAIYREKSGCAGCNRPVYQFYDGLGRLVQTRAETLDGTQQAVSNVAYDARGLTISATVPLTETYDDDYVAVSNWGPLAKTTSAYDALGRTTIITATDGTKTIHSYTLDTNTSSGYTPTGLWLHAVVDPNNHARQEVTDGRGRTIIVRELTGMNPWNLYAATRYQYNTLDLLTRVTDTVTNTTVITYNALGLKTAMSDPDMGTWKYGYDAAGNILTQTNALNQTLWFKYDALNRLKEKRDGSPTGAYLAQYGYDGYNGSTQFGRGQRTAMTDTVGTALWTIDQRGRVLTETRTITTPLTTFVTGYRYDALDRVITTTYPTGEVVTNTYNAQGLLENVRSQTQAVWYASNLDYDVAGRLELLALGNTLQTDYVYHPWTAVNGQGRLKQIKVGTGGAPTSVQDWQYGYDAVGNVKTITDTTLSETHNYAYDYLDRLVSGVKSTGAGYTSYYTYTVLGNLQNKTVNGVTVNYTYPGAGQARPHAVTALSNGSTYTYDASGNMTVRVESSITYSQTWNKDGLLTVVTNTTANPDIVTKYSYDGDAARVKKEELSNTTLLTTTLYVGAIELQIAGTTRITSSYYFAGAQLVAMREMTNTGGVTNTLYFLHTDHLGSNSITTNASGSVLARQSFMPYGGVRSGTGVMPTDIGFTGQRLDAGTGGLMYYGARFYAPGLGRFLSADTVVPGAGNPQALNRFSYALSNPLKYTDPSGHCTIPVSLPWGGVTINVPSLVCPGDDDLMDDIGEDVLRVDQREPAADRPMQDLPLGWEDVPRSELRETAPDVPGYNRPLALMATSSQSDARSRLPAYSGGKTQGILDTGTEEIGLVSGRPTGDRVLPGNAPGHDLLIRDHVEAQASALMRNQGIMDADLYINNTPCPDIFGCDRMLPHMLPEGATLRMHIKHGVDDWEDRIYNGLPDSAYIGPA
jgi:RHS repeat-associated protein